MKFPICGSILCVVFCLLPRELKSMPQQITKLIPIEDWIAFKSRTNDVKPLDKFLGKLRATYDFVFQKPDNDSNVEKILSEDKSENIEVESSEKLIKSNSQTKNNISEIIDNKKQINDVNNINVELFLINNITTTKPSSISRISKDNEWLDDIDETPEPLSELEIIGDENIDRSVEVTTQQMGFQLPIAVARAFAKWLGSILGFTRGAYLKLTHSTV
ncbi:hypothetical protein PV328_000886 [Microctonus aethiopoides]|uniref:Uncharacterized protein n=1 Tax=Microctonus aethiopoides TaxID=144406 RepID=A0AA39FWB2_9HYME|nr:hypothetical protein PV328_000886 [Microctonus aethiopoides]